MSYQRNRRYPEYQGLGFSDADIDMLRALEVNMRERRTRKQPTRTVPQSDGKTVITSKFQRDMDAASQSLKQVKRLQNIRKAGTRVSQEINGLRQALRSIR